MQQPVIAAVNGTALGAGFGLMAACDIMLAVEGAMFGMPEIDVGLAGGAAVRRDAEWGAAFGAVIGRRVLPTVARATGVSWMTGVGRIGGIFGATAGGVLLQLGWGFEGTSMLDPAEPPTVRLRVFMVESAGCFQRFRWAWIASASMFWNDPHERRRAERIVWRDRYEGLLRAILQEAMDKGEIRQMDVSLARRFVLGTLNWLPRWYSPDGPLTPPQIAEQFYDMAVNGLTPRQGKGT